MGNMQRVGEKVAGLSGKSAAAVCKKRRHFWLSAFGLSPPGLRREGSEAEVGLETAEVVFGKLFVDEELA